MSEPKWLTVARGELGTREIEGPKSNSRIVEYAKVSVGVAAPDSEAWCARFVGWCLEKDGLESTSSTRKSTARSYMQWGDQIDEPQPGCIVVFWRGSKSSWQGHVGFFIKQNATHVWVLGGNQSNKVSIAKYPKKQLLGYRWPARVTKPAPKPGPDPQLKRTQARLKELGYHEVGTPDGLWGSKTRAAVRAFYDDWNERNPEKELPTPKGSGREDLVTDAFVLALAKADHRSIAPEREAAGDEKIGDYAAVKEAKKTETVGKVVVGTGAAGAVAEVADPLEKVSEISEKVWMGQQIVDGAMSIWEVVQPFWPIALVVGGIAVIWWMKKVRKEEIESFRMGETP